MKKIFVLAFGLMLTAASCNLFGSSGTKGVLKSEDGGETYKAVVKLEKKGDIGGVSVNTLAFDPVDSGAIYLGSGNGMYRTTDGGETWKYIMKGMRVGDIEIDPSQTSIIYASGITGENGRILKSTDGGSTWKDIYTEPTKNNPVLSLAISRATSKVLLAGLNNGELLRSADEGATWQIVKDFSDEVVDIEYKDGTTAYVLAQSTGLYLSVDQGSNWNQVPIALQAEPGQKTKAPTAKAFYGAAFDRNLPGVIFLATEQGLLRTVDSGATWSLLSLPATNQTLKVSSVAIDPTSSNTLMIAVGSTMFKTNNGGVTWETRKLPSQQRVRRILIDPDEPNKIYLGLGD